jgi:hypothetical protein
MIEIFVIMFYNLFLYMRTTSRFLSDDRETCAAAEIVSLRLGPCFCVFDCVSPRAPFCRVL